MPLPPFLSDTTLSVHHRINHHHWTVHANGLACQSVHHIRVSLTHFEAVKLVKRHGPEGPLRSPLEKVEGRLVIEDIRGYIYQGTVPDSGGPRTSLIERADKQSKRHIQNPVSTLCRTCTAADW